MNHVIKIPSVHVNLSPDAFQMWAEHYYKCKQDFFAPSRFSPVPYFLLSRSIELGLKAKHLDHKNQREVKSKFSHNLLKAYNALLPQYQILSVEELDVLKIANKILKIKALNTLTLKMHYVAIIRIPTWIL